MVNISKHCHFVDGNSSNSRHNLGWFDGFTEMDLITSIINSFKFNMTVLCSLEKKKRKKSKHFLSFLFNCNDVCID
ncbi:hypothetical protein DICVIV_10693 [Dictyocaulus viviparus]|uniref:Uncharacterized protein n=1 Tax=Dictyocaulus viviparus TaxID=29172 RepID=A0A0D8XHT8_DICVI|nr:hypothetical protein DICVIV_10693 [Dictyocaulus viviparus]